MNDCDTIAVIITPSGDGGVGIIRISDLGLLLLLIKYLNHTIDYQVTIESMVDLIMEKLLILIMK